MLARVQSCAIHGIDGVPLIVEVDARGGDFKMILVGLPDTAIKESQERVYSALRNSGFRPPIGRTVINLAPADMRKEGSALDLPIALGCIAATQQIAAERLEHYFAVGELALNGAVRPVDGALPMAIAARDRGLRGIIVPEENAMEAGVLPGVDVIPVRNLAEAAGFIHGSNPIEPHRTDMASIFSTTRNGKLDLSDVKGQAHVKRAMTIAAAGGHNLLMVGPPGTGKTMLAARLPTILPDITFDEALETSRIYSVAGTLIEGKRLVAHRPFRSPHHTATTVSICGGGAGIRPMPGEVSMAHNGVLFLDELPEFNRGALEALRQPLEDGIVHIRRANYSVTFPSRVLLVVAMNPCPCGYAGDARHRCRCSTGEIQRYMARLSGPLLDRIDIHAEVPGLTYNELSDRRPSGASSTEVRQQVQAARDRQRARYKGAYACNAHLDSKALREHCILSEGPSKLLQNAIEHMGLSARAYNKILRVARTMADLDNVDEIQDQHISEAVQYRNLDRITTVPA